MPIAVRQLNFVYNPKTPYEKHALIDVNLEVNDGEFLCIVGHTGSGKSTFVQHLNALVPVQSGFVEVNGLDLTLKKKKLRREMLKQLRGQVGIPISGVSAVCLHSRSGRGFRSAEYEAFKGRN